MEMKFFICEICGNIIAMIRPSGVPVVCCGEEMTELIPNTTDGAHEKHVPVVTRDGSTVTVNVGSIDHPMLAEHYIEWIAIETKAGNQLKALQPGQPPRADFCISEDDEIIAVYEHCNIHGLWKA